MASNKATIATPGSIWINPFICNPKKPVAQILTKAKQSRNNNFDIILNY
jgi:hypothetical protein